MMSTQQEQRQSKSHTIIQNVIIKSSFKHARIIISCNLKTVGKCFPLIREKASPQGLAFL